MTTPDRREKIISYGEVFERLIIEFGGRRSTAAFVKAEWFRGLLDVPAPGSPEAKVTEILR